MAATIEFHPLFWEDVETHALYLQGEAQLGDEFLDQVEEAISKAKRNPNIHSVLYGEIRHIILKRFKNHILHYQYIKEQNLIRFYGLYHGMEDPEKWYLRE